MRGTTSGWIAGTLGVGLTASIVLAQQLPTSGGAGSSSTEPASVYGASATRGARYLLRNGLDYIQYQQYDRALKFLREAETRQKELGAAERQDLKRGIEAAQAGLRAAADSSNRYAMSERSRRQNGFAPARPESETAIAARPAGNGAASRTGAAASRRGTGRIDGDDGPGEPIRLASIDAEAAAPAPSGGRPSDADLGPAPAENSGPPVDPHSARSEIPALDAPGLPNLTAVPSPPDAAGGSQASPAPAPDAAPPVDARLAARARSYTMEPPTAQPTAPEAGPTPADARLAARVGSYTMEPPTARLQDPSDSHPSAAGTAPAPAAVATSAPESPKPDAMAAPTPAAPATRAPTPTASTPATILLETPDSAPATAPGSPAPADIPALRPAGDAAAGTTAPPATGDLVPAALQQPAAPEGTPAAPTDASPSPVTAAPAPTAASPGPAATDADFPPLPALGAEATRAPEAGGIPHRESQEPAPAPSAVNPEPAVSPTAAPATAASDELPPLPVDLGRDAAAAAPAPAPGPAGPADSAGLPVAAGEQPTPAVARPEPVPVDDPAARSVPAAAGTGTGSTPPASSAESLPQLPDDPATGFRSRAAAPGASTTTAVRSTPDQPAAPAVAIPVGEVDGGASAAVPATDPTGLTPTPAPTGGTAPTTAPAPEPSPAAGPVPGGAAGSPESSSFLPAPNVPAVRYSPEQARRIAELTPLQEREDVARNQMRSQPRPESPTNRDTTTNLQTQTQYDIIRYPSPAEARPIKAIPVPEDWVPLAARNWTPQRKYWAPAATCHLPLYFQDPVLERYGHPVEQFVGPIGRYLSYPVDDPRQSTQRNQILQPLFSWGLFALQIAAWPYNGIMDPPWEAQYDLGYYRPGDMVPTDIYWLPLHGYGPPLRGNSY